MEHMPRKGPARPLEAMPEWMRNLKGFDELKVKRFADGEQTASPERTVAESVPSVDAPSGGTWRMALMMPRDISDTAARIDPILFLPGLAGGIEQLEARIIEVVRHCRANGRSWTQIGDALSISKQAAWERFSGEE
jgi:hypothetical protein